MGGVGCALTQAGSPHRVRAPPSLVYQWLSPFVWARLSRGRSSHFHAPAVCFQVSIRCHMESYDCNIPGRTNIIGRHCQRNNDALRQVRWLLEGLLYTHDRGEYGHGR